MSGINTDDAADDKMTRRNELLYLAELSTLYHRKRERFYDWLDRFSKAVAVIGGSAAFAAVAQPATPGGNTPTTLQLIGAAIAVTSAISLVFAFSERARKHGELAKQFCETGAEIARVTGARATEEQLGKWDAQLRQLEANEPATLRALVLICQNQLNANRGAPVHPIKLYKRITANLIDWNVEKEAGETTSAHQPA